MKKYSTLIVILFLFVLRNYTNAQCGSFPMSIYVPTLTCAQPTGTITITTTVSPVTCVWAGPGIVSGGNTLSPVVNVGGIYSYTLTNASNGCTLVHPGFLVKSPVSVTNPQISCSIPTATMTANVTFTPTSYSWSGPGIISGNTINPITINAPGYYVCTVTNSVTGCQVLGSGKASLDNYVPPITINTPTISCAYPVVNLVASSPSFSPSLLNFSWQGPGIVSGATTQTASVNAAGVYTCVVTNTLNGCMAPTTSTVSMDMTKPAVAISGSTVSCPGQTFSLSASGANTYTWFPGGLVGNSISMTQTATTTYTAIGASPSCTNTGNSTFVVTAQANPTITASVSPSVVCSGNSATLTAAGAQTYTWMPGWMAYNPVQVTPSAPTVYTVTGDAFGCIGTTTLALSVVSSPTVAVSSSGNLTCANSTVSCTASGATSYTWAGPGIVSGTNSSSVTVASAGVYTVVGSNAAGCTNVKTVIVMSNTLSPTVTGNTAGSITCITPTAQAMISASGSPLSFNWSGPAIASGSTTQTITVFDAGVYSYTVTNTNNACITTGSVSVFSNTVMPTLSVTPSATLTCNAPTVALDAYSTGSDVYYNWQESGGVTISNSQYVSVSQPGEYTCTATNTVNGCSNSATAIVVMNAVPPYGIIAATDYTVCQGSSTMLSFSVSPASTTYSWSTGQTDPMLTVTPVNTQTYGITFMDNANGCVSFNSINIVVDGSCQDVWPGDANSDGYANNLDVLELGLHYMQAGAPRTSIDNSWQSFHADNWTGTISNGQNVNHSDCNGDGTVNSGDTLAIYNNYGFAHAFKQNTIETTNPQLSIVPNESALLMGYWGSADIFLGDAANPINTINGVAFTIDFDNALIEQDSVYLEYTNSFIDAANQNLKFRKLDFANGKLYTATTHTNNMNVSGNGKIGTLHYKIKYPLTQTYTLQVGLSQANQSDNSGVISPLTTGTGTVEVINGVVGIQSLTNDNLISVSPNPAINELTVRSNSEIEKVEITNVTGQIILCEQANSRNYKLNLENISNGVYFVKVYQNAKQASIKKVVIQK